MRNTRPARPDYRIKRVIQRHDDGCGIACVAMLANVSYRDACATIFGDQQGDATSLDDLRWAFRYYGLSTPERMIPFWECDYTQLRQHAVLALDPAPNGQWHWAVWDALRRRIVDPLKRPANQPVVIGLLPVNEATVTAACAAQVSAAAVRAGRAPDRQTAARCRSPAPPTSDQGCRRWD